MWHMCIEILQEHSESAYLYQDPTPTTLLIIIDNNFFKFLDPDIDLDHHQNGIVVPCAIVNIS